MRKIENQSASAANTELDIHTVGEKGPGGAYHYYLISGLTLNDDFHRTVGELDEEAFRDDTLALAFQNGPVPEVGVNGVTMEALLSIVKDRLECFQEGPYACDSNEVALQAVLVALDALNRRTTERQARGVEGTYQK